MCNGAGHSSNAPQRFTVNSHCFHYFLDSENYLPKNLFLYPTDLLWLKDPLKWVRRILLFCCWLFFALILEVKTIQLEVLVWVESYLRLLFKQLLQQWLHIKARLHMFKPTPTAMGLAHLSSPVQVGLWSLVQHWKQSVNSISETDSRQKKKKTSTHNTKKTVVFIYYLPHVRPAVGSTTSSWRRESDWVSLGMFLSFQGWWNGSMGFEPRSVSPPGNASMTIIWGLSLF